MYDYFELALWCGFGIMMVPGFFTNKQLASKVNFKTTMTVKMQSS